MSSVNQHTPARAIAFVAMASFAVGAQQVVGLLIIQFGAEDHQIGVATGWVMARLTFYDESTLLTVMCSFIDWQDLFEQQVVLLPSQFIAVFCTPE